MKFLDYTKKLYEKVAYYDELFKNSDMFQNPFSMPVNIVTVVWIEDRETPNN